VVVMRCWLFFLTLAACGRIGIDERHGGDDVAEDAATDAVTGTDASPDSMDDAALACPADMTRLSMTSMVCIELDDRGAELWQVGKDICEAMGRRYCTDAEWFEGCQNAVGLVDISGDDWEWVAEEASGVAQKRGPSGCTETGSHVITDPYEVRCCGPML
jgi:hypothetical protein